jgi:lysophospholipase L1-like esterase
MIEQLHKTKKSLLIWCGDSWTAGAELKTPNQDRFPTLVSDYLGIDSINLSKSGSSINYLIFKLKQILKIKRLFPNHNVVVLFGLTVPGRLCIENENGKKIFVSPNTFDLTAYTTWAKDVFSNKHIQTQTIINLIFLADQCSKKNIPLKFINTMCNWTDFQGNWFDQYLEESDWLVSLQWSMYSCLFDVGKFDFNKIDILEKTSHGKKIIKKYIYPSKNHPNISGHQKIAKILIPYVTDFIEESIST